MSTPDITATRHTVQIRAFVGPPWRRAGAGDYWPWTGLALNTMALGPSDTTIVGDLEPGATSVQLGIIGTWPTGGGVWIGPNGTGECWEYVTFSGRDTNVLTGCTREPVDAEQSGHHTSGAAVKFWWPLETDDRKLELTDQIDDNLAAVDWSARLGGFNIPQMAVRNRHLVVIQARWPTAGGAWDTWQNELIGWLLSPRARDGTERERRYDVQVACSGGILALVEVPGVKIGADDAAQAGDATASPELTATYKEQGSGEFTSGEPNVSPSSAIDGQAETLYISERHVGSSNRPSGSAISRHCADNIHIAAYTGQGGGGRWIQWPAGESPDVGWSMRMVNKDGYYPGDNNYGLGFPSSHPFTVYHLHPVILVESEARFRDENPDLGPTEIIEISARAGTKFWHNGGRAEEYTAQQWWDAFAPAGGALLAYVRDGVLDRIAGQVLWGSCTLADCDWNGAWKQWEGASLPAVGAGETIRRIWAADGNSAAGWAVGRPSTPGYYLNGIDNLYFLATTRPLGLRLKNDITATEPGPGDALEITSDKGDTVDGLAASGTLQIGGEHVSYSTKAADNKSVTVAGRGVDGTPAASHNEGDTIYVVDAGVATDAILIDQIGIPRPEGRPFPQNFELWASKLANPRKPGDPNYYDDYVLLARVTSNGTNPYTLPLTPSQRYRNILLECYLMTADPYRLMLNEFEVRADKSVYAPGSNLPDGSTAAQTIKAVLDLAGFDTAAGLIDHGDTTTMGRETTDTGMAGQVVRDLADYAACRLTFRRDGKIEVGADAYWTADALPAEAHSLSNIVISSIEPSWEHGYAVGQIKLRWKNAAGNDGTVVYPATPDALGQVVEVGPYLCANAAAAAVKARRLYQIRRWPFGVLCEAAGTAWTVPAGSVAGLTWQLDDRMLAIDRTYMVKSATHQVEAGEVHSAVQVLQLGREDDR